MNIKDDVTKVNTVAMYFTDVALLWWRRRSTDVRRGGTEIGTWKEFQDEFKAQFYPEYAEDEARAKLHQLTQRGTVREYVREFSELMLQISDLSEKEAFFSFTDGLKPWAKQELQRRGVRELTKAMMVAESIVELAPRRDRFETSKPNRRGNGGYHEEGEDGQSYDGNGSSSDGDRKPRNGKWRPNSPKEKRGKLRCYFCKGPHMKRDCPKVSSVSAIKRSDELEEAKPIEEKPSRVNSMVLIPEKKNGKEGLMFVDINIAGQKQNALIDTGASDLFISEKAARKLGLPIKKSKKKIKTINSKEAPTMGVVRNVELHIGEWKGKEDFEVIELDDYDYVLGLNFFDRIQTVLYPWADQIHIITGPLTKIVVPVLRNMKVGAKVLSSIQLVEDVSYGRNIDSIERVDTKAPSKVLVAQEFDMKPADSTVEPTPLGKVGCASGFKENGAMQRQSGRVNATSKVHSEHYDSVLHSNLCTWQESKSPFEVLEQRGRETVGKARPRVLNQEDSVRVKLECGQESDIAFCRRDVQTSRTVRVKKRRKPRQKSQRKGKAKASKRDRGEASQCHSEVVTRTLREWVGENVTGRSSKPVTIAPNASNGGLLLRWGSFGPRELARFSEQLEEPVKLKPD
ncbi:hypothetical protein V6Z11_D11G288400 [Gossypium hirsutum]